jgi:hypothetical protein
MTTKILRGKFKVFYYDYPAGRNNRFGAGGWSRNATSRPRPVLVVKEPNRVQISGKSILIDGIRKLKCTIVRRNKPSEVIREDYPMYRIKEDLICLA